jgi:hypothetical protein
MEGQHKDGSKERGESCQDHQRNLLKNVSIAETDTGDVEHSVSVTIC